MHAGQEYDPMMLDIFSCGVVLFTMLFGDYPFAQATERDARYKCILKGDFDVFWKYHGKKSGCDKVISNEFKELFQLMVSQNRRPSASQILEHAWFQKTCASKDHSILEISKFMTQAKTLEALIQ